MTSFTYSAYISYSHEDERWAKWLQAAIENYRVPRRLVGSRTHVGIVPRQLAPVFRDRSDLPTATNLSAALIDALQASASLVVICSPSACMSRWVNEEIRLFRSFGRNDRIFCLVIAGLPNASAVPGKESEECFPAALRTSALDIDGSNGGQIEPLAADSRAGKDSKTDIKLKIIAGILGVGFNALKHREHRRRIHRMAVVTALALLLTLIMTGLAIDSLIQRNAAVKERNTAERRQKQAENLVDFMLGDLNDRLRPIQRLDILEAVDNEAVSYFLSLPTADVTDQVLMRRVKALQKIGRVRADQGKLPAAVESYHAASVLAAELLRRAPGDPERERNYAETLNFSGNAYWFQGDLKRAENSFQQAVDLLERSILQQPSDEARTALASARTNAGRVLEARGDFNAAQAQYQAVLESVKDLPRSTSALLLRRQSAVADAYDSLGKLALERGQLAEGIDAFRDVRRIRAQLAEHTPSDRALQEDLLISDAILGRAIALCGATDVAARYVREAVTTAATLVAYDDTQVDWREELADYSRLLGGLARSSGHLEEARGYDAAALRILAELVATDGTNAEWRRELATAQVESARLRLANGDLVEVGNLLDSAQATVLKERAASPDDRGVRLLEANIHLLLGQVSAMRRDKAGAREHWTRASDTIAAAASVGADPGYLAVWATSLLLLDETAAARPVIDRLFSMGYSSRDLEALLVEKKQPYVRRPLQSRCGYEEGDASVAGKVSVRYRPREGS